MEIIIYGKDSCTNCDKTRMLCQIQSLPFQLLKLGADYSAEALQAKVGQPVRSLPQIFIRRDDSESYVGGYDELRAHLAGQAAALQAA
jgi:glutaredoxin